jgi:tetratricopeptide (TPR) repeat protein
MANSRLRQEQANNAPTRGLIGPAHLTLAEGLVRVGRVEEAISLYDAATRSDPASAAALLGLARALLAAGRAAEAFPHADAALALDFSDVEAWRVVAEALDALDEPRLAAQAFERALSLAPEAATLHLRLARLYEALDRPHDAAARFLETLRLKGGAATETEAHTGLSGLFGRAGQFAEARAHAEAALALAPEARGAHQNLAAICDHEGRFAEAEAHRERAYRAAPLIATRAAAPRRRVLTLASAERANSPDRYLIPADRYDRLIWFLAYDEGALGQDYDVAFNAFADADVAAAHALRLAEFAGASDKPLLNPPDRIARTTRDNARALFAGVADLVIPETRRVRETADLDGLDAAQPWLLRPLGSHGGERVEQLDLGQAAARLDGRPHYLTAFHDFRSGDGLYRKHRMVFVDREPFPYHLAVSRDWLVHYQTSLTPTTPALIEEEKRFLENPEAALGAPAFNAIAEIGRRLDLDFAGVDFAVLADGRALVFEANATMLVHPEPAEGPLRHKNAYVRRILEAFWARLESV